MYIKLIDFPTLACHITIVSIFCVPWRQARLSGFESINDSSAGGLQEDWVMHDEEFKGNRAVGNLSCLKLVEYFPSFK